MDGIGQAMQVKSKLRSRRPLLKLRKKRARVEKVEMQLDVFVDFRGIHTLSGSSELRQSKPCCTLLVGQLIVFHEIKTSNNVKYFEQS